LNMSGVFVEDLPQDSSLQISIQMNESPHFNVRHDFCSLAEEVKQNGIISCPPKKGSATLQFQTYVHLGFAKVGQSAAPKNLSHFIINVLIWAS